MRNLNRLNKWKQLTRIFYNKDEFKELLIKKLFRQYLS